VCLPKKKSKVAVHPIWLPNMSYLVEANGWLSSMFARFQQACRHMHGVVELGYVMLQYLRLVKRVGFMGLPRRTHWSIVTIAIKMHFLHITASAQAAGIALLTFCVAIPQCFSLVKSGFLLSFLTDRGGPIRLVNFGLELWQQSNTSTQSLLFSLAAFLIYPLFVSTVSYLVIHDIVSGCWYKNCRDMTTEHSTRRMERVQEDDEDESAVVSSSRQFDDRRLTVKPNGAPMVCTGPLSVWQRVRLWLYIMSDSGSAYMVLWLFVLIPALMASWQLLRRGTKFEYIVAPKPE